MAYDLKLDDVTRDYVDDPTTGGWVEVNDSSTAVKMQVECERGWLGDPNSGSVLGALRRSDLVDEGSVLDGFTVAMKQLVQVGQISNLTIATGDTDTAAGVESFIATWLDRASNMPGDLSYSPLGGSPIVP